MDKIVEVAFKTPQRVAVLATLFVAYIALLGYAVVKALSWAISVFPEVSKPLLYAGLAAMIVGLVAGLIWLGIAWRRHMT